MLFYLYLGLTLATDEELCTVFIYVCMYWMLEKLIPLHNVDLLNI